MLKQCVILSTILVALIAILIQILPVKYLMASYMILPENDKPQMYLSKVKDYTDPLPTNFLGEPVKIKVGPLDFILIVEASPRALAENINTTAMISDWYHENIAWFQDNLVKYGGILLRNFNVHDAIEFDEILSQFHRDSAGTGIYLGTAPRQKINGTRFVSTASDIPRPITIPTHIELSFTPNPPRRLYFFAEKPNEPLGGQTTYTDFRAVWEDLSPETREKLTRREMVVERRHHSRYNTHPICIMYSKSWQEMFKTENRTLIEQLAREQEFTPIWIPEGDELILRHRQLVYRNHSVTHRPYWATHFNVLHGETYEIPYAWSAQIFESKESVLLTWFFVIVYKIRHGWMGFPYGHNMFYMDTNEPIDFETAMEIRRAISRKTWIFDWMKGDIMIIDNHRLAHGRSPWWKGERKVYVAWN